MSSNQNPGNFANRPHEEVENIARKGGQSSHQGGFASMDPKKQARLHNTLYTSSILLQY
jgi:general stress protein YciG